MAVDQRDAAGELADLGEKLSRPLIDHRRDMTEAVALGNRDMAGQNDEHARSRLAGLEQRFAVRECSDFAEPAHARDFLRRQRRKGLLMARKRGGRRRAAVDLVPCRRIHTHQRLTSSERKQNRRKWRKAGSGPSGRERFFSRGNDSYLFGFFALSSCRARVGVFGRCGIAPPPRLGFSPLEIFAQCQLQPILPRIFRGLSGLALALVLFIRHRQPVIIIVPKPHDRRIGR